MELMQSVLKEFNNKYNVGDKVVCSFGLGEIIEDLGMNEQMGDHMFRVEFAPHVVKRNNLESNTLVLGSFDFSNRVQQTGMLETSSWDYMLDKDFQTPTSDSWNASKDRDVDSFQSSNPKPERNHGYGHFERISDEDYPPVEEPSDEELEHLLAQKRELDKKIEHQRKQLAKAYLPRTSIKTESVGRYGKNHSELNFRLLTALEGARQDDITIDQLYDRIQQACNILNPNNN